MTNTDTAPVFICGVCDKPINDGEPTVEISKGLIYAHTDCEESDGPTGS